MKTLIALVINIFIFAICITLFINLLPLLFFLMIVFLVMRYFKRNKSIEKVEEEKVYTTNGNIKNDVIDVEYKETIEK